MLAVEQYRDIFYRGRLTLDAVSTVRQNIERGLSAMEKALREKTSVHRAMYRQGLGWVDFVWGDEGKWPPTASGHRKGGKGISHAIEARMRKDGLSHAQSIDMLRRMVRAIAEGEEKNRVAVSNVERVIVGADGTEVHLVKRPGSNGWMLTVFDDKG